VTTIRAVLVGVVVAAAMVVAIRHVPVEEQKADAAISINALRGVGLMRAAAVVPVPMIEKPMVLPPLEPIPQPKIDLPARPAPPPKIKPPAPTMVTMRARSRGRPVEYSVCFRFGMHKVQIDRWRWRCKR
jgi:hypothetical protein